MMNADRHTTSRSTPPGRPIGRLAVLLLALAALPMLGPDCRPVDTRIRDIAYSPDGKALAWVQAGRLLVVDDASPHHPRQLAASLGPVGPELSWSDNSFHLYVRSSVAGADDIWEVDLVTGRPRQVTDDIARDIRPVFVPRSRTLVFVSWREGHGGVRQQQLWSVHLDLGHIDQLTFDRSRKFAVAAVEPGSRVFYHMAEGKRHAIGCVSLIHGQDDVVYTSDEPIVDFAVSADGRRLAVATARHVVLQALDFRGTPQHTVPVGPARTVDATTATVRFADADTVLIDGLARLDVATGAIGRPENAPVRYRLATASADGRSVAAAVSVKDYPELPMALGPAGRRWFAEAPLQLRAALEACRLLGDHDAALQLIERAETRGVDPLPPARPGSSSQALKLVKAEVLLKANRPGEAQDLALRYADTSPLAGRILLAWKHDFVEARRLLGALPETAEARRLLPMLRAGMPEQALHQLARAEWAGLRAQNTLQRAHLLLTLEEAGDTTPAELMWHYARVLAFDEGTPVPDADRATAALEMLHRLVERFPNKPLAVEARLAAGTLQRDVLRHPEKALASFVEAAATADTPLRRNRARALAVEVALEQLRRPDRAADLLRQIVADPAADPTGAAALVSQLVTAFERAGAGETLDPLLPELLRSQHLQPDDLTEALLKVGGLRRGDLVDLRRDRLPPRLFDRLELLRSGGDTDSIEGMVLDVAGLLKQLPPERIEALARPVLERFGHTEDDRKNARMIYHYILGNLYQNARRPAEAARHYRELAGRLDRADGFARTVDRVDTLLAQKTVDAQTALRYLDAVRASRCWVWGQLDEAFQDLLAVPDDDTPPTPEPLWDFIRQNLDSPLVTDADAAIALHAPERAESLIKHLRRFERSPYLDVAVEAVMNDYRDRRQKGLALAFARNQLKPWTPRDRRARLELWLGQTNESIRGRLDEALAWYRHIDDSAGGLPEWAEAVQRLALIEAARGNLQAAMQATARLTRLAPEHHWVRSGEALKHLSDLYLRRAGARQSDPDWRQRAFEGYLDYLTTYRSADDVKNLSLLKRVVPLLDDDTLARYVEALPADFEAIYPPDLSGRTLDEMPLNAWDRKRIDRIRKRLREGKR